MSVFPCSIFAGSIPAHAGEPNPDVGEELIAEVYPRPRGGTPSEGWGAWATGGLSPPTRGNHAVSVKPAVAARSIPAHAGEPGTNHP